MTLEKEEFEGLCAAYALGNLDAEEQILFDTAMSNAGEEYQTIFRESIGITSLINISVTQIAPSPLVKLKLLNIIRKPDRFSLSIPFFLEQLYHTFRIKKRRFDFVISILLLILIAGFGSYAYLLYQDLIMMDKQSHSYESRHEVEQHRLDLITNDEQQKEEIRLIQQSPQFETIIMSGLEMNPSYFGKIYWDHVRNVAIIHVSKLPAIPADKDYQLWIVDKNMKAVSVGIFSITEQDDNFFKVAMIPIPDNGKDVTAFTVTVEQKGGESQPTGTLFLRGELSTSNNF